PASAASAKAKFLDQSLNRPSPRQQPSRWRVWAGAGVAVSVSLALVLGIAAAIGVWFFAPGPTAQAQSEVVLDKLIDWNLQLSESQDPDERAKLYSQHLESLKADLDNAKLNDDDRQLAQTLLDNGVFLASNEDS